MSQVCDFYIECGEKDCVPVESWTEVPAGVERTWITVTNRRGEPITVTGVTVAGAIAWAGMPGGAPDYIVSFLTTFAGCHACPQCGLVGQPTYFLMSLDGERLCAECV